MSSRKKHLKQIKNDLLEYKQLLPPNFSHHEQMLDSYETESLERFKRQNIYTYCDLELSNLGNPAHLLLSSDNKYLIIIGQDNHIYIYDFIEKTSLLSEPSFISLEKLKFTGSISCVTLCEKSKCLFVGSVTGQIGKIELDGSKDIMQSLTLIKTIGTSPATSILSLSVSNDGEMLIYSDSEGIRTITLSVSEGGKGLDLSGKHYKSAFFVGQKQNLFINKVGSQSSEHCYEIRDRFDQKKILKPPESRAHYCVKLLQNKQYYLTLINKDSLAAFLKTNKKSRFTECQVFEVDKPDKPFRSFKLKFHHSSDFDKLQFHITKDDRFLCYYATNTSILYIYDFKAEKTHQMAKISGLAFPESRAVFSEDDSYLVIVQSNGIVIVCDLLAKADNLISHRILESFEGTQESFAVSNDFKHLAYFQKNKDVEVLDLKRNEVILSLPLTRHNKKLVSASMKFTQAPEGILIEYRFMSEIDSHKILECSVFKGLPPEKPVQPINIYDLRPTSYQNLDAYTMKDVDETEPLHNRDALMRGHEKPKETRGKAIVRNVTNAASFTRQLTNMILKDVPKEKWLNKKDSWHRKSLSFIAAQECVDNVMAKSETYLVAWFTDSTVKVYNFPALQEVYSWKSERGKVLSVVTSPNDDLILTISNDGFLEMRSFNFPAKFSSSSQKSSFYTFERYLRLDKISLEDGLNNPQNYYLSHEQTLLHLKSLANSDDLPNLIFDPASKVPFLRDKYNKTPLHYILCHEKLDYSNLNAVATYMLEYMKALKLKKENECEYVIESLNDILPILMLKLQPDLAAKYVEMAAPLKLVSEEKIDSHVFARNKVVYFQDTEFQTYMISELREGPEPIVFKELGLKIDYRPQSKDMMEYTLALSELEVEDLFKLPAVAHLVDYIWQSTKKWNFGLFIWFSILMILLSVYVGMGERRVGLEVTILVLATIGMNIELTQALTFGRRYWKTLWNKLDLVSLILIYVFIIFKFCDVDDELAENWIAAFMIFSGYIRLGAYLRFFRETRQLIEVIVTIIKDMISFLVIMILITIGFSVIFLKFLRSDQDFYLWHLYYSYQLWYGNTDGIPSDSPSVLVLECAIMFIMPVVLLNLLVTLMGESREKVKDRAILTDAKTRLSMSIEAMALMRIVYSSTEVKAKSSTEVAPEKKEPEKGTSLFVCIPKIQDKDCEEADKADEMTEIKGQIKDMMRILKELKEQQAPQKERMDDTGKDEALEAVKKFMKEMKTDIQKQILLETSEIKAHIHNQKMPPIRNHHKGGSPHGPNKDED